MMSSTASRAIAPITARLQLRLSAVRLSARHYAKPPYDPARRHTGGSIPREGRGGWGREGEGEGKGEGKGEGEGGRYQGGWGKEGEGGRYQASHRSERQQDSHEGRGSGYNGFDYNAPRPTRRSDHSAPRQTRDNERVPHETPKSPRVGRNTGYDGHNYECRDPRDRPPARPLSSETDWLPPREKKSSTAEDTIVPQLNQAELRSIFSQELFVFRCDLTATQVMSAMFSYVQLRDVGILTAEDISNLARQIHTRFRIDRIKSDVLPHIDTLITDIKSGKVPGHPLASVHIISCLKEMEEFDTANDFWEWLELQNEDHTDARVYGAVIECFAYQGEMLGVMEAMYTEALERYSNRSTTPIISRDTGKGTRLMLFQGIITARLLHGDWIAAYEGFDICVRLYPTLTPSRLYELIIYERPVKEAYIVFLMACRAGTPPKPTVLTPLLKQLWNETGDVRAMIRALYAFVGAGGKASFHHLNSLISAVWGSIKKVPKRVREGAEWDEVYANAIGFTRDLIGAFGKAGVPPSLSTFNTIITLGGKLGRLDLVYGGLKEMAAARVGQNLVTYRVILNSFGELEDSEAVQTSWKDLCDAKVEFGEPFEDKDMRALIRACVRTSQIEFCRSELERLQLTIGPSLYRTSVNSILREEQKVTAERLAQEAYTLDKNSFPISPENQHEVQEEIQCLDKVFSSSQIYDFASSTALSTLPANLGGEEKERVVDIDSVPPSFPEIPQTELQKFYDTLTATASKIDIGEDPLLRTATGYSVKDLRFENWRSVNRLLYEAELYEQEQKEKILKAAMRRAAREGVVEEEQESKDKRDVRRLFANEEKAKRRIEEISHGVKMVKGVREAGEVWRREELRVRGRMGGELKEAIRVSDVVVP